VGSASALKPPPKPRGPLHQGMASAARNQPNLYAERILNDILTDSMLCGKIALIALFGTFSLTAQSVTPTDFFETKVRPVLANNCFVCHNTKLKTAGLDLSSAAAFHQAPASGPLISENEPEQSKLLQVLKYQGAIKMPPMGKLPDQQIADIAAWVKMGAPWPETPAGAVEPKQPGYQFTTEQRAFWSFQPVKDYPVPAVKNPAWPKNAIDNFILVNLEEKGLEPSPPADRLTLLRRATFDLTGLPPTPKEIDDFLSDQSTNAFAKVVDRLLASPRYGERWGRHWLDVARYADSTGADEDIRYPYAWRYRDYVIEAFNRDLPYDQFVIQQLAGDLLPAAKPGQVNRPAIIATGFLAIGPKLLAEQDKPKMVYDMVDEQLDTTSRAFLGLTVACARCHDHKFDPIPTKDYYSLASVFASTKSLSKVEGTVSELYFAPLVPEEVYERYQQHQQKTKDKEREIEFVITAEATAFTTRLAPHLARYMNAVFDYEHRLRKEEPIESFAAGRNLDGVLLQQWIDYLRPSDDVRPYLDRWLHAAEQGAPAVERVADLYQNEFQKTLTEWQRRIDEWGRKLDELASEGKPLPDKPQFEAGDNRFFSEVALCVTPDTLEKQPTTCGPFALPDSADGSYSQTSRERLRALRAVRDEMKKTSPPEPDMACAVADGAPVEQHVLIRGNPSNRGDLVPKQFLQVLAGEHQASIAHGSGRLELAKWLVDPSNPLPSRVMVNRIWQYHFGEGLVGTPNNFGKLGEQPTNPELLDYLARRFVEGGWSIKKMHRLLMLSGAYQMSSRVRKEQIERDPANRLLSHFNRRRLDVEEIRDGLLAIDDSIDLTMGGTLQTGFGTDGENSQARLSLDPSTSKRRTVYLPLRRSNLPSILNLFDFGDATTPSDGRTSTNVAPQALFMMNSNFISDRARQLARRLETVVGGDAARIVDVFEWVLNRKPSQQEVLDALDYVRSFKNRAPQSAGLNWTAWQSLCRILISSNEFIYVD
jgi:cytochrome c553